MNIDKIKIVKLKVLNNPKGDLLKYLDKKNKYLKKFGETYFTEIKKKNIKGWNYHKKLYSLIAVPYGKVRFTFAEDIKKRKRKIVIGKKNYHLIVVPPRLWFKFESITNFSLVVNTLNDVHRSSETVKIPVLK